MSKEAGALAVMARSATKAFPKLFKSKYTTINPFMMKLRQTPHIKVPRGGVRSDIISNPNFPTGGVSVIGPDGISRRLFNIYQKPDLSSFRRHNNYGYIDADGDRVVKLMKINPPKNVNRQFQDPRVMEFKNRPGSMRGSDGKIY